MARRSLKRLAEDPRFISYIDNYCDRWCDRCALTSRCLVFARDSAEEEPKDLEDLMRRIDGDFAEAATMLREQAEERGIDLSAPVSVEQASADEARRAVVTRHPVLEAAIEYSKLGSAWLSAHARDDDGNHTPPAPPAAATLSDRGRPVLSVNQAVAVVGWYLHQIHTKIFRAISAASYAIASDDSVQTDANGSAKVALLGIDRSLEAWFELLHANRGVDAIMRILDHLSSLRDDVERAFPDARRFVRPGFDTGDQPWPEAPPS